MLPPEGWRLEAIEVHPKIRLTGGTFTPKLCDTAARVGARTSRTEQGATRTTCSATLRDTAIVQDRLITYFGSISRYRP